VPSKKVRKPTDDLSAVNDLVTKLVRRELEHYDQHPLERVPAALLSTASGLLKAYQVPEDARDADVIELAQESSLTFKSRLSPTWVDALLGLGEAEAFAGISEDDPENVERKALFLLKSLDASNPEYARLEAVVREARRRIEQSQQSPEVK
jgi:hypothetical protein